VHAGVYLCMHIYICVFTYVYLYVGERAEAEKEVEAFKTELAKERRMVMMDGLKLVFRGQALISILVGGALAFDKMPFFPDVPIAARAFGFWAMWLFTIPSLRAVKPLGYPQLGISPAQEKKALNLAFVLTPFTTIALPFATKDPGAIFSVNLAVVAACYGLYIAMGATDSGAVIHTHTHTHTRTHAHTHTQIHTHTHKYTHTHTYVYIHTYIYVALGARNSIYIYTYIHIDICTMYMCVCVCACVCVCVCVCVSVCLSLSLSLSVF